MVGGITARWTSTTTKNAETAGAELFEEDDDGREERAELRLRTAGDFANRI